MAIFRILRRQQLIGSIDTPHVIMPKAIHAVRCGLHQVLHETLIRDSDPGPTHSNNDNNFRANGPRTLPPPHILLQLGLAYMLHRSNSSGQVFELERSKHDQARLPSRIHGLQYPARVSPPHSDGPWERKREGASALR